MLSFDEIGPARDQFVSLASIATKQSGPLPIQQRIADALQHGDAISRALPLVSAQTGYDVETWMKIERQLVYDVILDGLDETVLLLFERVRFFTGNAVVFRSFLEVDSWKAALNLIVEHEIGNINPRPIDDRHPRSSLAARAANRLRQRHFNITAVDGALQLSGEDSERLVNFLITQYAARRYPDTLRALLAEAQAFWQPILKRYVFPRGLGTTAIKQQPTFPWNYALQLAARSWATTLALPSAGIVLSNSDLLQVTADFAAILDVEPYIVWEIAIARPAQYLDKLGDLARLQGTIDFQERSPGVLLELLSDLFGWLPESGLEKQLSFSLSDLLVFAAAFVDKCSGVGRGPHSFPRSAIERRFSRPIVGSSIAAVWSILVHEPGTVNIDFRSPDDWLKATLPIKPFVARGSGSVEIVDSALATESFLIAAFKAVCSVDSDANRKCGLGFERYVLKRIAAGGHLASSGFYGPSRNRSEIDAIFETDEAIIIVECKKRMLSPETVGGSRDKLVQELSTTVAKGHEQLLRAHLHLLINGYIRVGDRTISHGGREIFRVVVSLNDWGVFHDQAVVRYMLSSLLELNFGHHRISDPDVKDWIDQANSVATKLKERIAAIVQLDPDFAKAPFMGSFFLPIGVLDQMLHNSGSAAAFVKQLRMKARLLTGNLEPYLDYLRFAMNT